MPHTGEIICIEQPAHFFGECIGFILPASHSQLRGLIFDEHIGAVALFGIAVVDHGIVEAVDMAGCFPGSGMHEYGCIKPHHILVELYHRLPPQLFQILLQLHPIGAIVVDGLQSIVYFTGRINESVFLGVRDDVLQIDLLTCIRAFRHN